MLEDLHRELNKHILRANFVSKKIEEIEKDNTIKDPSEIIDSIQQSVPEISRIEEVLPMYSTPEKAMEASLDNNKNRFNSLFKNICNFVLGQ